jgi:preprotein translocase subunit YajC
MQGTPTWAPTLFMYVAFAAIFYFILLRPQQQQRKRHDALMQALKKGDEVVTAGGLVGQVVHIQETTAGRSSAEDRVTIKTGESRVVVERGRIARVASATAVGTGAATGTSTGASGGA